LSLSKTYPSPGSATATAGAWREGFTEAPVRAGTYVTGRR